MYYNLRIYVLYLYALKCTPTCLFAVWHLCCNSSLRSHTLTYIFIVSLTYIFFLIALYTVTCWATFLLSVWHTCIYVTQSYVRLHVYCQFDIFMLLSQMCVYIFIVSLIYKMYLCYACTCKLIFLFSVWHICVKIAFSAVMW